MFNLLSDTHGDLGRLFGIRRRWFFGLPSVKRATFVFDKAGVCQGAFSHEFNVTRHVQDALGVLKKLAT
jgi:peroxiredoxin